MVFVTEYAYRPQVFYSCLSSAFLQLAKWQPVARPVGRGVWTLPHTFRATQDLHISQWEIFGYSPQIYYSESS